MKKDGINEKIAKKSQLAYEVRGMGILLAAFGVLSGGFAIIVDMLLNRPYWKCFLVWAEIFETGKNAPGGEGVVALLLAVWAVIMAMIQYILTRMDSTIYGINMGKVIEWLYGKAELSFLMIVFYSFVPMMFIGWILKMAVFMAVLLGLLIFMLWYTAWLISVLDNDFIYAVILRKSESEIGELTGEDSWGNLNQIAIEKIPAVEMVGGVDYSNMGESEKAIVAIDLMADKIMCNYKVRNSKAIILLLVRACMTAEKQERRGMWFLMNYVSENIKRKKHYEVKGMAALVSGMELVIQGDTRTIREWIRLFRIVSNGRRRWMILVIMEYILYLLDAGEDGTNLWLLLEGLANEFGEEYLYVEKEMEGLLYEYWVEWHRTDEACDAKLHIIEKFIENIKSERGQKIVFANCYKKWMVM